jgi:hypothetical protein
LRIVALVFIDAQLWIPAIGFDFSKELVALHHARIPWPMVIQMDEVTITEFHRPIWQVLRNDMGVHVDFEHERWEKKWPLSEAMI